MQHSLQFGLDPDRVARRRLLWLGLAALAAVAVFLGYGVRWGADGNWSFVLPLRAGKVAVMCLVGYAIAVSTVLFQTVTGNRILTPAVMGFDALFVLLQTLLLQGLGVMAFTTLPPYAMFGLQVVAMVVFSSLLYRSLFTGNEHSLHLMVLTGLVFGTLFRALSTFVQGLIDPNGFMVLQNRLYANFNTTDTVLLPVAATVVAIASGLGMVWLHRLDVLALGRAQAINLGLDYRRTVTGVLALVAVLVSVSTALVGPVAFFGLLVAHLAYRLMPSQRHRRVLPATALLAVCVLVAGQFVLERRFAFGTALSIVVEFCGGILFLILLLRGPSR
jgi:iron complex transport system permease protein